MSIESDIIAVIESKGEAVDRLSIMSVLGHYSQGHIDVALSGMTRRGLLTRVKTGVYALDAAPKKNDVVAWLVDGIAPYQRVMRYLEAKGPTRRQALCVMLSPFSDAPQRVVVEMIGSGTVHQNNDGRIEIGKNPKAPSSAAPKHSWNNLRAPTTSTKNTSEAPRQVSAETTSEQPSEARAADSAGDAPDESAAPESPASGIGQMPAPDESIGAVAVSTWENWKDLHNQLPEPVQEVADEGEKINTAEEPEKTMPRLHAVPKEEIEGILDRVEKAIAVSDRDMAETEFKGGGGGHDLEPVIIFSMHTEEMRIDIDGDDDRTLDVIRGVLASLATCKRDS